MNDAIEEMKTRARLLLKKARRGQPQALARAGSTLETVALKHCLDRIAREFGFSSFRHAREVIDADGQVTDFGSLLYRPEHCGTLNHWFATYDEARSHQRDHGGYLLPYRKQFMVVGDDFVRVMGLPPELEPWQRLEGDWVRPADPSARRQLYANLVGRAARESQS